MQNIRHRILEAAVLSTAILAAPAAAQGASPPGTLRVMAFSGSSTWPLYVAQDKGFFRRNAVEIRLAAAPSSATQLKALIEGELEIAMTALDNVVAYVEGQGEVRVSGDADLVAFLGVNNGGRFHLVAARGVERLSDLKGRTLAVDALTTGYAFVLYEMLRQGGLARADYRVESFGGSRERWESLRAGKHAGTLLNAPFDAEAEAAGFKRLASSSDSIGAYQGSVGAARRAWAKSNSGLLVAYIRAYVAAMDWLHAPANREEAIEIFLRHAKRVTREVAEHSYRDALDPAHGSFLRRAAFDVEGARNVLRLRSAYAQPAKILTDPLRYYDPSYYRSALHP